ncbi:hypothetical protein N7476_008340 [Penicillium atrosanguineum]|uniref:Uncharacterized protein n=1 Tax=Penicillium atrosanguineum TaxID=1132637 RepID=A0A9W9U1Z5_9EURO|nr:hypothetical protein N7476_008340 [Penicillium atrosanguineum]
MPPKQAKPDSRSCTLLFKKHKTTVLLSLQSHESITSAKEKLLQALNSRQLRDINGDVIPDDPAAIELGVPMDRSDLDKGWMSLTMDVPGQESGAKTGKKKLSDTLQAAGLENGHSVAFRFRKLGAGDEVDTDMDLNDPGWDVIIPSFDEEEEA